MALGATYQLPVDDRTSYAEDYLRARITSALGGRAAEKLVYGVTTTGAENDLQQVTEIARQMVLRWGMSEKLGPISFVAPAGRGAAAGVPAPALQRGDLGADRRRGPAHRRGVPPRRRPAAGRAPRQAGGARPRAAEGRVAQREGNPGGHGADRTARAGGGCAERRAGCDIHSVGAPAEPRAPAVGAGSTVQGPAGRTSATCRSCSSGGRSARGRHRTGGRDVRRTSGSAPRCGPCRGCDRRSFRPRLQSP